MFLPYTPSPVWRYPAPSVTRHERPLLFDTASDPGQRENLAGQGVPEEARMRALMIAALGELGAPPELLARLGLEA